MKKNKKKILRYGAAALLVLAAFVLWRGWFSATRVAFLNYQVIALGQIARANDNAFIRIEAIETEELGRLGRYDMLFINGMGLRITEEQRERIQRAADRGLAVLTTAATNPANAIVSVDSAAQADLRSYLSGGGRRNYRNLLRYVRRNIDGKLLSAPEAEAAAARADDPYYHIDPKRPDDEELGFGSIAAYEQFLHEQGLWRDGAPHIVVTGQMGEPTELIRRLEQTGNVVYPVRNFLAFIRDGAADTVRPAAVINMAHGRLGDAAVDYLTACNIPLFAPLNVNRLVEEWEADKMGMNGGFLSQSVVTPEIDGAIRPFALFGHTLDEEGLQQAIAIPERLESFVETVNRHLSLRTKPNSEKRVAIYYYKGPGQSALTASGMEVVPSLYNLLRRMQREGYRVDGLPATAEGLGELLRREGRIFGTYAEGAQSDFLRTCHPALVTREEYDAWTAQALRPEKRAEADALNGEFPGSYMATDDGRLGVSRVQLGNVVLLPQPAAGAGSDQFKIVHGTDAAPPHAYIAAYLWARFGFGADLLVHFGTHGSLEFTPRKQVALSSDDWADRLIGPLPHLYVYSIDNVGEGVIAKRRSYATLQSYLTPPFLESGVRDTYRKLNEAIRRYNDLLYAEGAPDTEPAAREVKRRTIELGIHRELRLDSLPEARWSEEDIARVESFAEELAAEKITGAYYTMGEPYRRERIESSVYAMTTEPIAYSLLALDRQRGRAAEGTEKHKALFTQRYVNPARALVTRLLADPSAGTDALICRTAGITAEELAEAREIERARNAPQGMMAMMQAMAAAGGSQHAVGAPQGMTGDSAAAAGPMGASHPAGGRMQPAAASAEPSETRPEERSEEAASPEKAAPSKKMERALAMAKKMGASEEALKKMAAAMQSGKGAQSGGHGHGSKGRKGASGSQAAAPAMPDMQAMMRAMAGDGVSYTKEQLARATAIMEVERTIRNVGAYRRALLESPEHELASLLNAMNGGYTAPSPGGDPIVNPNTLPTGRNLYAINAEATPSEAAWEKGKALADRTIEMYRQRHNDSLPRKVSYTLWSGEFIETEGATIAQILYMLGVEPIRDVFGRVTDLRLIPSEQLGRPRIDVVVQTSGQLRDIAASRLFLISRAVEMAAAANDDRYENLVSQSVVEVERTLIEKGLSPKEAREISTYRVFGGVNGGYGTGITGMVQSGDRWEDSREIADVYLQNMGAFYGSEHNWEQVRQFAFEAALTNTDAVIQPRQSNTWGALSLDHVYEFMGGMNLAVRNITGKDPDAYLSDYRNRNNARMQEVKEAIGVESRTTIFNPAYIREKMKGDASSAGAFSEIVENTYGWNVMKPAAIDRQMWDEIYAVYVKDKFDLGVRGYFEQKNPAALQQMTAVMLESARKGMWQASEEQLRTLAELHTELIEKHAPSCTGFVCDNAKLRDFIASKSSPEAAEQYRSQIREVREAAVKEEKGMVLKREELNASGDTQTNLVSNLAVAAGVLIAVALLVFIVRKRRNNREE